MADSLTGIQMTGGNFPWDQSKPVNANTVMGWNTAGNFVNMLGDGLKNILNYKLLNGMLGLQMDAQQKQYDLQSQLIGLNGTLISSQEKVSLKQLSTTREIAELQKDRDVAIAKTRADAAVKIAKVNSLNTQFYGQPVTSSLPSYSA